MLQFDDAMKALPMTAERALGMSMSDDWNDLHLARADPFLYARSWATPGSGSSTATAATACTTSSSSASPSASSEGTATLPAARASPPRGRALASSACSPGRPPASSVSGPGRTRSCSSTGRLPMLSWPCRAELAATARILGEVGEEQGLPRNGRAAVSSLVRTAPPSEAHRSTPSLTLAPSEPRGDSDKRRFKRRRHPQAVWMTSPGGCWQGTFKGITRSSPITRRSGLARGDGSSPLVVRYPCSVEFSTVENGDS
jgi:hypothetical protein